MTAMDTRSPSEKQSFRETALGSWLESDLGRLLVAEEQDLLAELSIHLFGYQLLEISCFPVDLAYLHGCPVRNKIRINPGFGCQHSSLTALPEQLPITTDSVDAVILSHTLDFAVDPRQVLREVERVLIPEGRVIICGFNPYSLWGVRRWLPGKSGNLPWGGRFLSFPRLQDWLSLLGFDVEHVHCRLFRPPLQQRSLMSRLQFMEGYGQRFLPWVAGIYVVQAVKRVSTVTPIRPKWHIDRKLGKSMVEPSSRTGSTREING